MSHHAQRVFHNLNFTISTANLSKIVKTSGISRQIDSLSCEPQTASNTVTSAATSWQKIIKRLLEFLLSCNLCFTQAANAYRVPHSESE